MYCIYCSLYIFAVAIFRLYAEDTSKTTVTVKEGQQFRICVSKSIVTARNVRYFMYLFPRTANSKEAMQYVIYVARYPVKFYWLVSWNIIGQYEVIILLVCL